MMQAVQLFTVVFCWSLLLSGCYSRKEACLDNLATNFDVTADDACTDVCCTYPPITIDMTVKAQDSIFSIEDTLINKLGQKYRIIDLRCYFTEFSLYQNNGSKLKSLELITTTNNTTINNDIVLWKWADASFSPGTYKAFGQFDSLTFFLGLSSELKNTTFTSLTSTHPLSESSKLKGNDGLITDMTIRCIRLINKPDTINLTVSLDKTIKIQTKKIITTTPGSEIKYGFSADFHALLYHADLRESIINIENNIKSNISASEFVR